MRPTVKDIARHAGVSAATVSLVLRNSPLVAATTRAGVQSSMDSLGYVYHRAAANLRARLTHTVGLVICEITNPFYAELAAGIDDALDQAGWVAFVANTAESPARQSRFIARMREHRVDGILLAPAEGTAADVVDELKRNGVPVVQMLRRVGGQGADYVSADFRLGMTLAAEHLIRLGHKRIAFVGGARRVSPARDRTEAFRAILPRFGLPVGPIVNCLPTREEGAAAVGPAVPRQVDRSDRGYLPQRPMRARRHARPRRSGPRARPRRGGHRLRQHPRRRDASAGFDHRRHRRARDRGGSARLLLRRIKSPDGSPESIILPPKLVIRESCGARSPI